MAGFAKGMATTSGWTLVLCDCRIRIQQDRTLKDRARTKKMAAAADYDRDIQVRTKESIAQGSGYRHLLLFLRVTNFFPWMQQCTEPPSSEGEAMKGRVCGNTSMCDGPHAGFPRRATQSGDEGREAVHRGDAKWRCPD